MKKKVSVIDKVFMALLLLVSIIFVFPFYWIMTGAFKDQKVTIQLPPQWFPTDPTTANFTKLFQNPAMQWLMNSILISGLTLIIVCISAAMAGYVLAKKRFYGQKLLFSILYLPWRYPSRLFWYRL